MVFGSSRTEAGRTEKLGSASKAKSNSYGVAGAFDHGPLAGGEAGPELPVKVDIEAPGGSALPLGVGDPVPLADALEVGEVDIAEPGQGLAIGVLRGLQRPELLLTRGRRRLAPGRARGLAGAG